MQIPRIVVASPRDSTPKIQLEPIEPIASTTPNTPYRNPDYKRATYNMPDSNRLTSRLIKRLHKDITAEVGTYSPFPATCETSVKGTRKDVWGNTNRFPTPPLAKLGPGSYNPAVGNLPCQTSRAAFRSNTVRFSTPPKSGEVFVHVEVCLCNLGRAGVKTRE
jgi:hypothetical protein